MRVVKFELLPPLVVLNEYPLSTSVAAKMFGKVILEYVYQGSLLNLTGGVVYDPPDDVISALYSLASEIATNSGVSIVPTVLIKADYSFNVGASDLVYNFSFSAKLKQPFYVGSSIDVADMNRRALRWAIIYAGEKFTPISLEFVKTATVHGFAVISEVRGVFHNVVEQPENFYTLVDNTLRFVFRNLDEGYDYRYDGIVDFSYSIEDITPPEEVPDRYIIMQTSNVEISCEVVPRSGKFKGGEFDGIGKKLLKELRNKVNSTEWSVDLVKQTIEYSSDFTSANVSLTYKFTKLRDDAQPVILLKEGEGISSLTGSIIVILTLLAIIGITTAYIVKKMGIRIEDVKSLAGTIFLIVVFLVILGIIMVILRSLWG